MGVDFERERAWWDAKASKEELDRCDEAINRALRWRELEKHLGGVQTILAVGGGTGAFTIPLARRGYQVTHLDFSAEMLKLAEQCAGGLANIRFVQGNAVDLHEFPDHSFDLVLNMDGAISFCGERAEEAVRESCRVTGGTLLATASHKAWMVPVWVRSSLNTTGMLLPAVGEMVEKGLWHQQHFDSSKVLTEQNTGGYLGTLRAFIPAELAWLAQEAGLTVLRAGGLGSLSILIGSDARQVVLENPGLMSEFLDLCEHYDRFISPDGLGTVERAGLILVATRGQS